MTLKDEKTPEPVFLFRDLSQILAKDVALLGPTIPPTVPRHSPLIAPSCPPVGVSWLSSRPPRGDGRPALTTDRPTLNAGPSTAHTTVTNADDAIQHLLGLPPDEIERRLILATIDHCQGNKTKASRMLGIGTKTLYRKLETYGAPTA